MRILVIGLMFLIGAIREERAVRGITDSADQRKAPAFAGASSISERHTNATGVQGVPAQTWEAGGLKKCKQIERFF